MIDQDLGHSGTSTADRLGFQWLVAEVGLGRVGLVLGLEVSRLARNSSDWHHLLEICALTRTLILDEEGLYDPATFNDRLLLGLKGAMSEAELFVMRARLQGGILNKARRGALKLTLPIGLCYTEEDEIVLDPDVQVQASIGRCFAALSTLDQRAQRFVTFANSTCCFRGESVAERIKEKSSGERFSTTMCCECCITQPMREPMPLGVRAPRRPPMAKCILRTSLVPNGSC